MKTLREKIIDILELGSYDLTTGFSSNEEKAILIENLFKPILLSIDKSVLANIKTFLIANDVISIKERYADLDGKDMLILDIEFNKHSEIYYNFENLIQFNRIFTEFMIKNHKEYLEKIMIQHKL